MPNSIHRYRILSRENSNNPEQSFLVLRFLARYIKNIKRFRIAARWKIEGALEETEKLIVASLELVEWDEIDKLFEPWFALCYDNEEGSSKFPMLIWRMCR